MTSHQKVEGIREGRRSRSRSKVLRRIKWHSLALSFSKSWDFQVLERNIVKGSMVLPSSYDSTKVERKRPIERFARPSTRNFDVWKHRLHCPRCAWAGALCCLQIHDRMTKSSEDLLSMPKKGCRETLASFDLTTNSASHLLPRNRSDLELLLQDEYAVSNVENCSRSIVFRRVGRDCCHSGP